MDLKRPYIHNFYLQIKSAQDNTVCLLWRPIVNQDVKYYVVEHIDAKQLFGTVACPKVITKDTTICIPGVVAKRYFRVYAVLSNNEISKCSNVVSYDPSVRVTSNGNIVSGVNEAEEIPRSFKLYQNYPNPFNASTVIAFDVPKDTHIILQIFDLMGRRIRILYEGHMEAGRYHFVWNGSDKYGRHVSSGVYLISFQANRYREIKKCLLLK